MRSKTRTLPYEDSAVHMGNIVGWVCKTCERYWGDDEHMARYCCMKDKACECGRGREERGRTCCALCIKESRDARGQTREKHPWPDDLSVNPVTVDGDRYFFCEDDWLEWLADQEGLDLSFVEMEIAEPVEPPIFEVSEWVADYVYEGCEVDCSVDEKINALIRSATPTTFYSSGKAIDWRTAPKLETPDDK